jgi:hypothetical protein
MRLRTLLVLFVAVSLAPRAFASTVVVPDQYPTVSAAVASGADTIRVRDGFYNETVTIARPMLLARIDPGGPPSPSRPRVTALVIADGASGWAHVVRFRVDQPVLHLAHEPGPAAWLDDCDLDAGLARGPGLGPNLRVTGCRVTGNAVVNPYSLEFAGNVLTNGGLDANYEGSAVISGNLCSGAPGAAVTLWDNDGQGQVTDNRITDCGAGILVHDPGGTRIERNRIERCAGDGIEIAHEPMNAVFVNDNVLRDLGGDGIDFGSLGGEAIGNTIEHVAMAGIRNDVPNTLLWRVAGNRITDTGQAGVLAWDSGWIDVFAGNTILHCDGPGALIGMAQRADSNVVGRCHGDGIRVEGAWGAFGAAHNTLYLNAGSGLRVDSPVNGAVYANIGYGNGAYALDWSGAGTATLACNLGFGNLAGNVRGAEPSETDRDGNPLFCNLPADVVTLGPGSAAMFPGCETAGAFGPGCAQVTGVSGGVAAAVLRVGPQPARARVRFEWPPGSPVRLEVFDASGARRWRHAFPAWRASIEWDLRDERGARLAPGVYFVRAASVDHALTTRFVVAP